MTSVKDAGVDKIKAACVSHDTFPGEFTHACVIIILFSFLINSIFIQIFHLQLSVEGYPYTGMGNSTNKKDAQTNAARDFCQYLVRQGHMQANEVPAMSQTQVSCRLCLFGNTTLERVDLLTC